MSKTINETCGKLFQIAILLFALFALLFVIHSPKAQAASSKWHDLGGGKVRLLANLDPSSNMVSGVVEIHLDEGWSTYWRYPGSSGIPPKFDFSKSLAFSPGEVKFPAPQLVTQKYGSYAGYKKKVMFPFDGELLATVGATIHLDLLVGVCAEVCIPATATLEIKGPALLQSDPKTVQAVSFAKIAIPREANAQDVLLERELVDEKALYVTMKHKKSFGIPSLFVEGPNDWYLLPAKYMSQEEDSAVFELDISRAPKGTDILAQELRYTFVTGTSGIEFLR